MSHDALDEILRPGENPIAAYLARFGTKICARIEDPAAGNAIMCPHCDLEMSIVYWPPGSESIIIAFTCDPSGHGHWLGAWDAGDEGPT